MRRRALLVTVAAIATAVVAFVAVRGGSGSASTLTRRACSSFRTAFGSHGPAVRTALARSNTSAAGAARRRSTLRPFAAAAARTEGSPTPAPADLRAIDGVCRGGAIARGTAVAVRAPYLTDATPVSVTVNFATDRPVASPAVWFGRAGSNCHTRRVVGPPATRAVSVGSRVDYLAGVALRGLSPGTAYCYSLASPVLDVSTRIEPARFVTAFGAGDPRPFSFAVIGDWGGGGAHEANVLARLASSRASFVVTTGDNAYVGGTQADYGDLDGGNVFGAAYWPAVGRSRPTFAAAGNHGFSNFRAGLENWPQPEVVRASAGSDRRDRYCCTATLSRPHAYASTWYAFDWGPARFYVLEGAWADMTGDYHGDLLAHWSGPVPGCAPCGAERAWLEADLAAHRATPLKFAFFHYPLYVDASDHRSDTELAGPSSLEGLLARSGVDIVFNGHAHLYERNRPMIAGSPMLSYVTGGGGVHDPNDTLAAVRGCSPFDAYSIGLAHTACRAPAPATDADVYHFLLVTVDGRRVTVAPTNENGATFDVQQWTF